MAIQFRELETVSSMIFNIWMFLRMGCNDEQEFFCKINGEKFKGGDMFGSTHGIRFVKSDCLPLEPNLKAVTISVANPKTRGRLYVEFTVFDWKKIQQQISEQTRKYAGLEIRKKSIFYEGKILARTVTRWHFGKVTSPRTQMYSEAALSEAQLVPFMLFAELVYAFSCFDEEGQPKLASKDGGSAVAPTIGMFQVMTQEQRQELQQILVQEQKPLMQMAMYQMAGLFHRQKILRMSRADLAAHVRKQLAENPVLEAKE